MLSGNAPTVDALVDRCHTIRNATRDFMVDSRAVHFDTVGEGKETWIAGTVQHPDSPTPWMLSTTALGQLSQRLDPSPPVKYLKELLASGWGGILAAGTLNFLASSHPARYTVRCVEPFDDGPALPTLRAWLSDSYRRLDNLDLVEQALVPALRAHPGAAVESANVSVDRFSAKIILRDRRGQVAVGDEVCAGVMIENSETGGSALTATPFIFRLTCTNGAKVPDRSLRQIHLGGKDKGDEAVREMFSAETLSREAELTFLKFRDVIAGALSERVFDEIVYRMRTAATEHYTGQPEAVADTLAEVFALTQAERMLVQGHLHAEPKTRWGMLNAVTASANQHGDYDRADHLQEVGGRVLTLDGEAWRTVSTAMPKYTSITSLSLN